MEQNRQRLSTVDFNRKRIGAVRDDEASVKSEEGGQNGAQRFNKDRPQDTSYRDGCSVVQARMVNSRQQISQDSSDHRATSQSLNEGNRSAYSKPPSWQDEDVHSVANESDHVLRNNTPENQNRTPAQRVSVDSVDNMERRSINREIGHLDESLRRLNVEEYDRERRMTDDASRRNLSRNSYDKQSMPVRSVTQNRGNIEGYCPQYRSDTSEIEPGSRIQMSGLRDI